MKNNRKICSVLSNFKKKTIHIINFGNKSKKIVRYRFLSSLKIIDQAL